MTLIPSVRVVLVLYRQRLDESPAYQSLQALLQKSEQLAAVLHLLICDNSPAACDPTAGFRGELHHDASNPGLAKSYNLALSRAAATGDKWLMLLDQDTVVTAEYLTEIVTVANRYAEDTDMVAAVPKLMERGIVQSPHFSLAGRQHEPLPPDCSGFLPDKLRVYNSGALVRVSRLLQIGGFPEDFWLDFLDHATFHLLCEDGGKILVMQAALQHQLSTNSTVRSWNRAYLQRHRNVLEAEHRYYQRYGTAEERKHYRMRLLGILYGSVKHLRFPMAWQLLRTLVRIR